MADRLAGKRCLITGAASGLGAAMARAFVGEGASVIVADIDAPAGAALAAEIGPAARFLPLDVTSEASWQAAMAAAGPLDVLVNNAGITTLGSIEEVTLEAFRHEFEIDVVGVFLGCKYGIARIKANGAAGGAIINMSSMTGVKAQANLCAYNAAKAAVTHMTKSVALHCCEQGYNIRVNSIHPGIIRTAIVDKVLAQAEDPAATLRGFLAAHPIGRMGEPAHIAAIAIYLASDEATFATGAEFRIDGGSSL